MNVSVGIRTLYEGDYITLKAAVKKKAGTYKSINLVWNISAYRFVNNHDIKWIRKNQPGIEEKFQEYAEFVCKDMLPKIRGI
jgi:hypothetical protein